MWRDLYLGVRCWLEGLQWTLAPAQRSFIKKIIFKNLVILLFVLAVASVTSYSTWHYLRVQSPLLAYHPVWLFLCLATCTFGASFFIFQRMSDFISEALYQQWAKMCAPESSAEQTLSLDPNRRSLMQVIPKPASTLIRTLGVFFPFTSPFFVMAGFSWQTAQHYTRYLKHTSDKMREAKSAFWIIGALSSALFYMPIINTLAPLVTIKALENLNHSEAD